MSAILYLEHLTETDLGLLAASTDTSMSLEELRARLRTDPDYLDVLLRQPRVYAVLFDAEPGEILLRASSFLVFAVLVQRVGHELGEARFIQEWVGPGQRMPLFEVRGVQEFVRDPLRRLFLAELLASYTRVASGSIWIQTARGWRRRRYSELDPMRLIELLETAPERDRPFLYRRLGDLSLFLSGVFPDYAGQQLATPLRRQRLERALYSDDQGRQEQWHLHSGIWLLERLGRHAYRSAWRTTEGIGGMSRVLSDMTEGFGQARRVLNVLTDRYMFPHREQWFPLADS